jgi:transposase InsO family protein
MQLISGVAPKTALPQFWAGQADVTHLGSEQPLAVAVVVGGALSRAALMSSDADRHGILGLQQALSIPAQHLGDQGATDATSRAYIEPGSPWENGFAEWFNCRFRDELLNTELFTTTPEAQLLADRWRWEHNTFRPHSALQGRRPLEAARQGAAA